MRYYYVPSTYRGRKFGRGFAGGNFRGCGRICGGSLAGLSNVSYSPSDDNYSPTSSAPPVAVMPIDIPIHPAQVEQNLLALPDISDEVIERARKIIAYAEATGKAKPITKQEAGLWSGIKNLGSKAWNAAKSVASNPILQTAVKYGVPLAMGTLVPGAVPYVKAGMNLMGKKIYDNLDPYYHQDAIKEKSVVENLKDALSNTKEATVKSVAAAPAAAVDAITSTPSAVYNVGKKAYNVGKSFYNWITGNGYRAGAYYAGTYRGKKLRKGSLEAKMYMARLRAMRGKSKKRSGKKGGMFRGVTRADIQALLDEDENSPTITVNWTDKNGELHETKVLREKAENMINATNDLINYYKYKKKDKNGKWRDKRTAEEIKVFRKENREAEGRKTWKAGELYKRWGAKRNRILMRQLEDITGENRQKKWNDMRAYWEQRADPALVNYIFATGDRKRELEPELKYKIRKDVKPLIADMTTLLEQRMGELWQVAPVLDNVADAVAVAQNAADIAQDAAADAPDAAVPVVQAAAEAAALNAQQAQQAVTTQQAISHAQAAVGAADTAVTFTKKFDGKKKKNKKSKKHSTLKASLEAEKRALKKAMKSSPLKGKVIAGDLNDPNDPDSNVDDPLADLGLSDIVP